MKGPSSHAELRTIYALYCAAVRRWASRVLRDGATHEDVVQEVMLRVLRMGATLVALPSESQKRKWMHSTTMRVCWDLQEKQKSERERAERWAEQSRCDHCAASGEARLLLDELLQSLSMEERIVAVLLYEERYRKMEIHKLLGRSRPHIDKIIRRIEQVSQRLYGGPLP